MSRHYDTETGKEIILSKEYCRWLYDEFWCCCKKRFEENEWVAQDVGEECGKQCRYFTPENII